MYCTIIVLYYCSRYNTMDKAEVFVMEEGEAPKNTHIRRKKPPYDEKDTHKENKGPHIEKDRL